MRPQSARLPKRSVALRARVVSVGPLDLLHLFGFLPQKAHHTRERLISRFPKAAMA
jgi:hypothetical protein